MPKPENPPIKKNETTANQMTTKPPRSKSQKVVFGRGKADPKILNPKKQRALPRNKRLPNLYGDQRNDNHKSFPSLTSPWREPTHKLDDVL